MNRNPKFKYLTIWHKSNLKKNIKTPIHPGQVEKYANLVDATGLFERLGTMSDSIRHCSLYQLQLFSASLIRDITSLVLADKLRYAIPIKWEKKEVLIYDTLSLPKNILDSIGKVRLEPSNEIVVTMSSNETPQTSSKYTIQPYRLPRASACYPETQPGFIYFRHSKVVSDTDSETHFVIEFETIDGEPITLWETRAVQEHMHFLLKAIRFHKFNWDTASLQAQMLLEAEFSVDEIECLTQRSIEVATETHTSANQRRKSRELPERKLPTFRPTTNKLARTICLYASKFMSEKMVEPTEKDLWAFMWNDRDQCDFELRQSTKGTEVYYLAGTEINLVELRHRLSTYRVPFLGKK